MDGCCYGFPDPNGLYSADYKGLVFPVQLYESLSTIPVVILLTVLLSKKINLRKGCLFPIASIGYSLVRIFWENYRYYDNQWENDFFLKLNFRQFRCVVAFVGGCVWLLIMKIPKFPKREEKYYLWHERMLSKIKK